jgi:hypothetical protein
VPRWSIVTKARKQFYFEKKNQKTFARWLRAGAGNCTSVDEGAGEKSFLLLFFKKKTFLFLLPP